MSGEICNHALTGTWTFKEGYTTDYNGGGVVVKFGLSLSGGQSWSFDRFRRPNLAGHSNR